MNHAKKQLPRPVAYISVNVGQHFNGWIALLMNLQCRGGKKRNKMCTLQHDIRLYQVANLNIQLPVEHERDKNARKLQGQDPMRSSCVNENKHEDITMIKYCICLLSLTDVVVSCVANPSTAGALHGLPLKHNLQSTAGKDKSLHKHHQP